MMMMTGANERYDDENLKLSIWQEIIFQTSATLLLFARYRNLEIPRLFCLLVPALHSPPSPHLFICR